MLEYIEKLELINVVQGVSVLRGEFTDRPSHALIFRRRGESKYFFHDCSILHSPGEVLFIPRGETYAVRKISQGEGRYIVINFIGKMEADRPMKVDISNRTDYDHLCARLCELLTPDTAADRYRAMALLYEVLALIAETSKAEYRTSREFDAIEPAVKQLREKLFDPALRIGQMHSLCGLSDTYFRRVFLSRFGTTPKKYIFNKRLSHAKALLDNGEFNSIAEVAFLSGFEDPLYFSKVFRQRYGCPPSKWK